MFLKRLALMGVVLGAGLGSAACTDGYGYSGVSLGYGSGGYYDDGYGYADPYYGGYGYGAGSSYFGWYGDYYYPGTGIYVYDRYRRPYRWNDGQRRYWEGRRNTWRGDRNFRNDWNGFDRRNGDRGDRTPGYRGGYQGRGDRTPGYPGGYQNRGDRTPGYQGGYRGRGDRTPGAQNGYRGDRTPDYRSGDRGDRGNWRTNRPNVSGNSAIAPRSVPSGGERRGWGGYRGGNGGGRERR